MGFGSLELFRTDDHFAKTVDNMGVCDDEIIDNKAAAASVWGDDLDNARKEIEIDISKNTNGLLLFLVAILFSKIVEASQNAKVSSATLVRFKPLYSLNFLLILLL